MTFFLLLFSWNIGNAQVGIGTDDPRADLDLNGNLKIRETLLTESISEGQTVLYIDNTTIGDAEIKKVTTEGLAEALGNSYVNSTVYGAKRSSGLSLLSLSIFANYQPIVFTPDDKTAGLDDLFTSTSTASYYTVPSDGTYIVNYSFTYGTGLQASILSTGETPGIGLLRLNTETNDFSVLHSKDFAGVTVPLVISLTISTAELNGIYELTANDRIYFAVNQGGVSLGLLGSSKASFSIYKISN